MSGKLLGKGRMEGKENGQLLYYLYCTNLCIIVVAELIIITLFQCSVPMFLSLHIALGSKDTSAFGVSQWLCGEQES